MRFSFDLAEATTPKHQIAAERNLSIACLALSSVLGEEASTFGFGRFISELPFELKQENLEKQSTWVKKTHNLGALIVPGCSGWNEILSGLNTGSLYYVDIGQTRLPNGELLS